jgi:hypothetical protein
MILIVQENDSLNVFNDDVIRYGYGQLRYVAFKEALDDCDKNVESFKNKRIQEYIASYVATHFEEDEDLFEPANNIGKSSVFSEKRLVQKSEKPSAPSEKSILQSNKSTFQDEKSTRSIKQPSINEEKQNVFPIGKPPSEKSIVQPDKSTFQDEKSTKSIKQPSINEEKQNVFPIGKPPSEKSILQSNKSTFQDEKSTKSIKQPSIIEEKQNVFPMGKPPSEKSILQSDKSTFQDEKSIKSIKQASNNEAKQFMQDNTQYKETAKSSSQAGTFYLKAEKPPMRLDSTDKSQTRVERRSTIQNEGMTISFVIKFIIQT